MFDDDSLMSPAGRVLVPAEQTGLVEKVCIAEPKNCGASQATGPSRPRIGA
ncbi:hypothetical protein ACFWPK_34045 [Nocardia sp. NPDC058519]|uniref:hypothetical protein n=1 Tax=Nocardia sp. NPDC058519 TaxID=3346535 RepID=UPI003667F34B